LSVKSQFTINIQYVLYLNQRQYVHVGLWTAYFIKGPVKVVNGLTGINSAMVKRHCILSWRWMLWGFFKCLHG